MSQDHQLLRPTVRWPVTHPLKPLSMTPVQLALQILQTLGQDLTLRLDHNPLQVLDQVLIPLRRPLQVLDQVIVKLKQKRTVNTNPTLMFRSEPAPKVISTKPKPTLFLQPKKELPAARQLARTQGTATTRQVNMMNHPVFLTPLKALVRVVLFYQN